ncbi:roadblock/LC7 domain-containing protein [Sphaerisporangium aureirubrum]|uniref:Roadblock/LC7 domain-containing protein n=1 Tax=Sphaerisporangium aureirubrum TaxID=1544736 RepID=A0ABW1NNM9_9ACTN
MLDIEACLADVVAIPGALDALLVEDSGGAVVASGSLTALDPQVSADAFALSLRATLDALALSAPGGTVRIEDVIVTSDQGHHLLRPLDGAPAGPMLLYLRLDRDRANLALARHRLRVIAGRLATS